MRDSLPDAWATGASYERFMGRWSRAVAETFLGWLNIPAGQTWGDIGCGTGALTASVLATTQPAAVVAADRSAGFVAVARSSITDQRAQFAVADATALPWKNRTCAVTVAGLALNFIADPHEAVGEMIRVTQLAGKVYALSDSLRACNPYTLLKEMALWQWGHAPPDPATCAAQRLTAWNIYAFTSF
jgi:ubiquinone/menaquinone biosynthesis C-methylase UbiE